MSSDHGIRGSLDPLQREAIGWVARLTSGDATAADAESLRAWRALSPAHEEAFRLASAIWREAGQVGASSPVSRSGIHPTRRRFIAGIALSSGAAIAAGWAGASLGVLPSLDDLLSDYYTRVGEQKHVVLSDGSGMDLDAGSAVDAAFTSSARALTLLRGAALFTVAQDSREFRVSSGPGTIVAEDAVFSLSVNGDQTLAECVRGRISVECGTTVDLRRGQRVRLSPGGISPPEPSDPATAAPWLRGLLIFESLPLDLVVADLNRHRLGRIILARSGIGARKVSGVFHLDRTDEIVDHLITSLRLSSVRLPGGIVLLG